MFQSFKMESGRGKGYSSANNMSVNAVEAYQAGYRPAKEWPKADLLLMIEAVNKDVDIKLLKKLDANLIRLHCLEAKCEHHVGINRQLVTFYDFNENYAKNITNKNIIMFIDRKKANKKYERGQREYFLKMRGKCKKEAEYYKALDWKEDWREIRRIEAEWDNLFYACDFYIADFKKRCKRGDVDLDRLRANVPIKAAKYREILSSLKESDFEIYEFMHLKDVDLSDDFTCLKQFDYYKNALCCRYEGRGPWMWKDRE